MVRRSACALWLGTSATVGLLVLGMGTARAEPLGLQMPDVHERPFDVASLRGRVVVLTFGSHANPRELERINMALRGRVQAGALSLVCAVDLSAVPSFVHALPRRRIAAAERSQGFLKFIIDADGRLRDQLGVRPRDRVDVLVLGQDGTLRGRFQGEGELPKVQALVDELQPRPSPPVATTARPAAS